MSIQAACYIPKSERENNAYLGALIGDAFGAGWEMKSRQFILEHWDEIGKGYRPRDPGHDQNHKPGMYTDDFEMTLGTLHALLLLEDGIEIVDLDQLIEAWKNVYQVNTELTGHAIHGRAGYGSILRVFILPAEKQAEQLENNRIGQANKTPGNANCMRQAPILFHASKQNQVINAVNNALATHPHPIAVFSCLCLLDPDLQKDLDWGDLSLTKLAQNAKKLYYSDEVQTLLTGNLYFVPNDTEIERMIARLIKIDQLPLIEIHDDKLANVPNSTFELLAAPYAKPCGGIGLSAKSEQTTYCALWLLKNFQSALPYGNLLRCIAIGGDTDTLASIVMSFILPLVGKNWQKSFPDWVLRDLEKPDHLIQLNYD